MVLVWTTWSGLHAEERDHRLLGGCAGPPPPRRAVCGTAASSACNDRTGGKGAVGLTQSDGTVNLLSSLKEGRGVPNVPARTVHGQLRKRVPRPTDIVPQKPPHA